jgi:hypothetical protein
MGAGTCPKTVAGDSQADAGRHSKTGVDETPCGARISPAGNGNYSLPGSVLEMNLNYKWCYFLAAAIFAGFFLIRGGAPPVPIALGIAGAALFTRRTSRAT